MERNEERRSRGILVAETLAFLAAGNRLENSGAWRTWPAIAVQFAVRRQIIAICRGWPAGRRHFRRDDDAPAPADDDTPCRQQFEGLHGCGAALVVAAACGLADRAPPRCADPACACRRNGGPVIGRVGRDALRLALHGRLAFVCRDLVLDRDRAGDGRRRVGGIKGVAVVG